MSDLRLPDPECEWGYTTTQLEAWLGAERWADLGKWMEGQTMMLCNGRKWDADIEAYEPACGGVSHGTVLYPWDVQRWLDGRPVID